MLETLGRLRPAARPGRGRAGRGEDTHVAPGDDEVSGFVFKIQANMDPNHRDRIAFVRLASGRFTRGMKLKVENTGRQMSVNSPILFFASDRELAEEAYAGDVIGIPNHGVLRVGDSLSESGALRFAGLPNFAPEILRRVRARRSAQGQAPEEGPGGPGRGGRDPALPARIGADFIVGAVGQLQFEVMADRLVGRIRPGSRLRGRAVTPRPAGLRAPSRRSRISPRKHRTAMARDIDGSPVFLAKSAWEIGYVAERFPDVAFERTRERG